MSWIDVHLSIRMHPKTLALLDALEARKDSVGCPLDGARTAHVVGHLVLFWLWSFEIASPDGVLAGITPTMIARASDWPGDPKVWIDALVETGWLHKTEQSFVIHDWLDYGGKYKVLREKDKRRKRSERILEMSSGHPQDGARIPSLEETTRDKTTRPESTSKRRDNKKPRSEAFLTAAALSDWASYLSEHWQPFVNETWQTEIAKDYSNLPLLTEAKKCVDWWAAKDDPRPTRPASAFRNWLENVGRFAPPPVLRPSPSLNGSAPPDYEAERRRVAAVDAVVKQGRPVAPTKQASTSPSTSG